MATVLVVDDHAVNREFLVNLLSYRRHRLIEAADGTVALRLARETRPDLIISDILMPSGDGYELVRALRQDPALAAVPVIFYTAHYNEREALSLAQACGVNCVLTKPTAPDVILKVVDDMLAARDAVGLEPAVPHGFDRSHLRLVSKKLLQTTEELDWTTSRLMALIDMNLQLASEREPHQLARNFCRWTRDLVAARHAVVGLWTDDDTAAGHVAVSGMPEDTALAIEMALLATPPYPMPQAGAGAQRAGDRVPARTLGLPDAHPPVSTMLVVPVTSMARRFGWVCATGKIGRDGFNADDERLLSIFASQVGRIFENHCLLSAVTARTRELEVEVRRSADSQWRVQIQYAVAHVLAATSTIAEAAPELLKTICRHTGLDMAELWDIEPDGSRLRHLAVWHADPQVATAFIDHTRDHSFLPGVGMPGTVWETGQPIWIPDVAFGDNFRRAEKARAIGVKSAFAFPVIGRGRVVGILGFFGNHVIEADPEHIALFTALGSQVGQFIDRRAQEERILRLARIQAVMTGINALIVRVGDHTSLFEGVCEIATNEGKFSHAAVITVGDDRPGLIVDGQDARLVDLAITSKRPAIDNDLNGNAGHKRSRVALPLTPGAEVAAVLVLHADATGFFTDDEMTLLTQLAADISFALETLANRARLRQVIYFDPLTGLPNRALFQERLGQALHVAREEGRQLAVITCSPRNFDSINVTLGRHVGDEVLRQVAQRLQAASRFPDNLARTSGEGFSTFNPDIRSVSDLMLRLAHALEDTFSITLRVGEHDVHMNIQVGVAVFPADGTDGEALLASAEAALQGARSTTARISFFEPAMQEAMARRMALETRLAHAVAREEFVLHYQPKIDVATRALVGFEALIRWRDPMIGLVPPDRFIPLLEENGLIVDVGFWAFRQAARDHLIWRDAGLPAPPIAVNVSVVQLQQPDFVENVAQVLRGFSDGKDGSVPHGLDIEVTESAAMTSVEHTADKLRALRDLGIAISIDDFGTGHSSLGYLAQLPVSALKIDRSFVSTMTDKPASLMIVEAVISLAHSLDLHVIAEGVETEEQLALLRRFRCDQAQGYLISRPVDAEGAASFMRSWRGQETAETPVVGPESVIFREKPAN